MDLVLIAEEQLDINSKWKKVLLLVGVLLVEVRNEWEVVSSLTEIIFYSSVVLHISTSIHHLKDRHIV